jgi:phosphoenolpyruvate carboxykinase (ATP)
MDTLTRKRSLETLGILSPGRVHENLPAARLVEEAIRRREGILAANGALVSETGERTGRSPDDKFIVENGATRDRVDWGSVNRPVAQEVFNGLLRKAAAYLESRDEIFVLDAHAGADPAYTLNVQIVAERAWHALFARQLFRRPTLEELESFEPDWTVVSAPGFRTDPDRDGTNSDVFVGVDFEKRVVLICGTEYAGEIKKSIFTVLNFVLPVEHGVFPMHCSANVGREGDVALFFGLSGTGKTSLSADPERRLIGDDEHGWTDRGIFNFEGGCYAKCIDLSPEKEPQIYNAIRFGAVVENVVVDERTREVDFTDASRTENTRAAYPLEFIEGAVLEGMAGHPKAILFLTADAFGVLPPISRLSPEQAAYYFLSGYTAKLAGTEAGLGDEPQATFSTCFGAPFLPLPPTTYSGMLQRKMREHNVRCYLVNTGWSGGPYGVGERIDIAHTRAMVRAAISGELAEAETRTDPHFGLKVPLRVPGVPEEVLNPRETWPDREAYDEQAKRLAARFRENFRRFEEEVSEEVRKAGPKD